MGVVAVVSAKDLADVLRARGVDVIECAPDAPIDRELAPIAADVDAIVVGSKVADPIQTTQRAYRLDPVVSVVLLATTEQCRQITDALRFTPFVGKDVACNDVSAKDVAANVTNAAARTRSRRTHRGNLAAMNLRVLRTEPRVAPPREQFLAELVDTAPIGIVALDASGRVLSANGEAAQYLRRSERDMLGAPLDAAALGATPEAWRAFLDAASVDRSIATFETPAGLSYEVRIARLSGARGEGYLVLLQDVTEQVRAAEVREAAGRRAEEASRLKDEFIAMVSHELRTPLNAVIGWTRMLRSGQVHGARADHALDVIERNATAQAKLIADLLDVSRIIGGKMRLEIRPTRLDDVVRECVESLRVAASAKGVRVTLETASELPEVLGDPDRLQQVVWNLLSNAVKFTPRDGQVNVSVVGASSALEVIVSDTGEGIPPEALPYVFDPFRQVEGGTTRHHGGLGLGLAIARRLIELHGGTVTARSAGPGRGATFQVHLPAPAFRVAAAHGPDVLSAVSAAVTEPPTDDLSGARVLVVDDDEDTRELVVAVLAGAGADVAPAVSARDAHAVLAAGGFDLIVSDVGMPGEDGYAFITRVRQGEQASGTHVPAIALTAYAREEDRARALRAGFDAHAAKPIDPSELVSLARSVLRRSS